MAYEKYPRTSVLFNNVAPDSAYRFEAMCKYIGADSGDYLTKLLDKAILDEVGEGPNRVFATGYELSLKDGAK